MENDEDRGSKMEDRCEPAIVDPASSIVEFYCANKSNSRCV
jgi:hypothetical protein